MNGKTFALVFALLLGFGILISLWHYHDVSKRIGAYLSQHQCTHVNIDGSFESIYQCEGKTLTKTDIIDITNN